ncbi:alpha-ketoglutarate dehydrogenase component 4 [Stomoxys calcitrans]|uniref:28S ribosomal protein S36, mitochondrial n=1 Tax=Stomoxys calcitrans TaxID=35570 RepID=A0A1I8PP15_STOCA|nr:alpha-ketoglutarate dehydrogenase component 4 [Stomoxys calcitrans]
MVFRTLVVQGAKRVPLIKFRKGGYPGMTAGGDSGSNQASSYQQSPYMVDVKNHSPNAIEDWELPPRYWRKPISVDEMEYINRGGPA